jgi:hypothetical protein
MVESGGGAREFEGKMEREKGESQNEQIPNKAL